MFRRIQAGWAPPTVRSRRYQLVGSAHPTAGFTLVEMLVAMAITLVMMGAVVTLFANVSNSVRNRRATMEMSGQIRGVRNVLQQDLQGATCPGLPWQRPESNHGYIELIEGEYREGRASRLIDGIDLPTSPDFNPEIDHALSILPSSNLQFTSVAGQSDWATDGGGLGDYDDILMLTVRNEHHPFVGRTPAGVRDGNRAFPFDVDDTTPATWSSTSIESPLAEVVWFSIENPEPESANPPHRFFGEPGMRTIYRRTLLIAPWVNPYRFIDSRTGQVIDTFTYDGSTFKAEPGLVRVLPKQLNAEDALAAIVAFQDRYDLSVRLEWDHNIGRYKIMANTLGDLTKRENRFGHYGFAADSNPSNSQRKYAFAMISAGGGYAGSTADVTVVNDPEVGQPAGSSAAKAEANILPASGSVISYTNDPQNYVISVPRRYAVRPFAYVDKTSSAPATAQVMLNDDGSVVRVVHGPVPLWGPRRGEDVMLTDVLSFDLRVFDPGAPVFATRKVPGDPTSDIDVILTPGDPGWSGLPPNGVGGAYFDADNMGGTRGIYNRNSPRFQFTSQGAYVDLGYGFDPRFSTPSFPVPSYPTAPPATNSFGTSAPPWFFTPRALSDVYGNQLAPGYAVYDTWSFHYENNGVNEDDDEIEGGNWQPDNKNGTGTPLIDEGTNGLDDYGHYYNSITGNVDTDTRLGVDDVGERETVPPYDKPLRGVQLIIRAYERDSRAIKQVRVNQHFMPE
jgi:prepilin-type N-terminal cleavage/methylation domain-containing protein